ncbi:MAG: formylglycine-generating enzyme family protein [Nitrosomonas sp.]|nr:formylglycine-generating enzyme family protein [Nitrosomonas sp.]
MKSYQLFAAILFGTQVMVGNAYSAGEPGPGTLWTELKTGMEFVWAPSGCFQMGGDGEMFEKPVHKVCLKGFWIGRYEVTQKQYQQVMDENQSLFQGASNPIDRVSWLDASEFAKTMSKLSGTTIALPSEAQWEYACRAGGLHETYCGNGAPKELGWFYDNSEMTTHLVGKLAANEWGIYDMSGNAWEWTQDCQNLNYKGAPADGSAWESGSCGMRVGRGGAWNNHPDILKASHRKFDDNTGRDSINGMRVVRLTQ